MPLFTGFWYSIVNKIVMRRKHNIYWTILGVAFAGLMWNLVGWQRLMAQDCLMISIVDDVKSSVIIQTPTKYHSCNNFRQFVLGQKTPDVKNVICQRIGQ